MICFYSYTANFKNTGSKCKKKCRSSMEGHFQSCKRCDRFMSCSGGRLTMLNCPTGLFWDQNSGRCEFTSTTCNAGEVEKTTTTTTPTTTTTTSTTTTTARTTTTTTPTTTPTTPTTTTTTPTTTTTTPTTTTTTPTTTAAYGKSASISLYFHITCNLGIIYYGFSWMSDISYHCVGLRKIQKKNTLT